MAIERDKIVEILRFGVCAPSGDNSQPWKFFIEGNSVSIFNLPEKDNLYYNFRQNGSMVAHGGLIENILISSSAMGYSVRLELFPDQTKPDLISRITFEESQSKDEPLFPFIKKRATNRKLYKNNQLLTQDQRQELMNSASNMGGELRLIEDKDKMKIIGEAVSVNEIVALETKKLHNIFFGDIVWSEEDELEKKSGLFIKTLELPLPIQLLFRILKKWPVTNFLNKMGFARLAAKGNAGIYSSGSALGVVVMKGNGAVDFINAGRIMQRTWLNATKLGLSLQPVTGILFLMQRVLANSVQDLDSRHLEILNKSFNKIKNEFDITSETMAMLFRIGYGGSPSARSSRKEPDIMSGS